MKIEKPESIRIPGTGWVLGPSSSERHRDITPVASNLEGEKGNCGAGAPSTDAASDLEKEHPKLERWDVPAPIPQSRTTKMTKGRYQGRYASFRFFPLKL